MSFWQLSVPANRLAVISDNGVALTYGALQDKVDQFLKQLIPNERKLGFVFCSNTIPDMIGYIGGLQGNQVVCLLAASIESELRLNLVKIYEPEWLWVPKNIEVPDNYESFWIESDYVLYVNGYSHNDYILHPDLALLLSTSGTTGSPKMVRLSYGNIQANAESIADYLSLDANERPITTLPTNYSYGLSVINSHLNVGATILLTKESIINRRFWDLFREEKATSIAGVPFTYRMLKQINFEKMNLSSLKTMTQAGGRLDEKLQEHFLNIAEKKGIRFYVMYGQTEATARISYVPPDRLKEKIGSIGIAIPGGHLKIDHSDNEVIYSGPNVMMGYAENRDELAYGGAIGGELATGDLGYQDKDGYFYITGRKKRFIKLFGLRVNLDEIESMLEVKCNQHCYCVGQDDNLIVVVIDSNIVPNVKTIISEYYQINHSAVQIRVLKEIPFLNTGKVNYKYLQELCLK